MTIRAAVILTGLRNPPDSQSVVLVRGSEREWLSTKNARFETKAGETLPLKISPPETLVANVRAAIQGRHGPPPSE